MERRELTVGEARERGTLDRILRHLGAADAATLGPGDDCAVLGVGGELVVTTDTMVEGPDFRLEWHTGFELGWKLAVSNLSDVAAMGAKPIALTVALAVPTDTPVALLEELARGLDAACRELAPGCGVVGGDLGRAPALTAAVTALGDMEGRGPVTRAGAGPGDIVAYAGDLGLAGLGLELLFSRSADADGTSHARGVDGLRRSHPALVAAQLAPTAPIAAGVTAALSGATAMLDVSDGLALDAARLAGASAVVLRLDSAALDAGFARQRGEDVPIPAMLFGGEDHGLLATFPPAAAIPPPFMPIGRVEDATAQFGVGEVLLDGTHVDPAGWDPYGSDPAASGR